jgi:hypothetical protein
MILSCSAIVFLLAEKTRTGCATREEARSGEEEARRSYQLAEFTTYSGERCIYHPPSGAVYTRTKPERCYTSGEEAVLDGCRPSKP